jgi:hypothetical protein
VTVTIGAFTGSIGITFGVVDGLNYHSWCGNCLRKCIRGVRDHHCQRPLQPGGQLQGRPAGSDDHPVPGRDGSLVGSWVDTSLLTATKHGITFQVPTDRIDSASIS